MQGPTRGERFFWFHNREKKIKRNPPPVAEPLEGEPEGPVSRFGDSWSGNVLKILESRGLEGLPATPVVVEVGAALARLRGICRW